MKMYEKVSNDKLFREYIFSGNLNGIKKLITKDVDIGQTWGDKQLQQATALIWATFLENIDLVSYFTKYINVNIAEKQMKWTALHFAAKNDQSRILSILIKSGAKVNAKDIHKETPIFIACWKGHLKIIKLLMLSGAKLTIKNIDGQTPYDVAVKYGHLECARLIKKTIKYLFEYK